jgi:hypothetical protein
MRIGRRRTNLSQCHHPDADAHANQCAIDETTSRAAMRGRGRTNDMPATDMTAAAVSVAMS